MRLLGTTSTRVRRYLDELCLGAAGTVVLHALVPADIMLGRRLSAGLLADALESRLRELRDFLPDRRADLLECFGRPQCQQRDRASSRKSANGETCLESRMILDPLPAGRALAHILLAGSGGLRVGHFNGLRLD